MLDLIECNEFLKDIGDKPYCFLAAISFEERSTAWATFMADRARPPERAVLFDYTTEAEPADEDTEMRGRCRSIFSKALQAENRAVEVLSANAFAANALTEQTATWIKQCAGRPILVDISCLTRIHLIALVGALRTTGVPDSSVFYCYTIPDAYGFQRADRIGWRDVLFIRAGKRGVFKREGFSRGIILAGHDGERLSVALQELEPASGTMVYSRSRKRPDFLRKARDVNESVERRLKELLMPRWDDSETSGRRQLDRWQFECVATTDFEALAKIVQNQVVAAAQDRGPVVIFPFGPKPMSLSVALMLSDWSVGEAWAVYPVPERFSVTYSSGVAERQVFRHRTTTVAEIAGGDI